MIATVSRPTASSRARLARAARPPTRVPALRARARPGARPIPREIVRIAAAAEHTSSSTAVPSTGRPATGPTPRCRRADRDARIVCARYLAERRAPVPARSRRRAGRPAGSPFADPEPDAPTRCAAARALVDEAGRRHRLAAVTTTVLTIPAPLLATARRRHGPAELVRVLDVTEDLQAYEPVRTLSAEAVARPSRRRAGLGAVLRAELARPPRAHRPQPPARERVAQSLVRDGLSMSGVTLRCGRVDATGEGT